MVCYTYAKVQKCKINKLKSNLLCPFDHVQARKFQEYSCI